MERARIASSLLLSVPDAAVVRPLSPSMVALGNTSALHSLSSDPSKCGQQSREETTSMALMHEGLSDREAPVLLEIGTAELPEASLTTKSASGTLSAFSAAAASFKGKTQQVAQQQKRALSAFQQKGGLVRWLHGEAEDADEPGQANIRTAEPSRRQSGTWNEGATSVPTASPQRAASFSLGWTDRTTGANDLQTPPSPRSPAESRVEKLSVETAGRMRSMSNLSSGSLLDSFFDKMVGVTSSSMSLPSSPSSGEATTQAPARAVLRPASANLSASSFDGYLQQVDSHASRFKASISPNGGHQRQRAATTDQPLLSTDTRDDGPPLPALFKSQSAASLSVSRPPIDSRFSLDEVLADEWHCTVLWAYLYSSVVSRDHQYHQRLSFLIEANFRVTPLYRKLTGLKGSDFKPLVLLLKRLHRRFLAHIGAAALTSTGVPVASPAAIHLKHELSVAVLRVKDDWAGDGDESVKADVEKAMLALFQLTREIEREFRVLGTKSYAHFADSALYATFVTREGGRGDIVALLRASRIPFYQEPNAAAGSADLDVLVPEHESAVAAASVFTAAGCQVFAFTTQGDNAIKFTDILPAASSSLAIASGTTRATLLQMIEPFLNPSASVTAASKPITFSFVAGSGENVVYGAVMRLPLGSSSDLKTEAASDGLCVVSKHPLVDSLRHFLRSFWRSLTGDYGSNGFQAMTPQMTELSGSSMAAAIREAMNNATLGFGEYLLTRHRELKAVRRDDDRLPTIDFGLADLFDCLSLTHVLQLLAFVLLEKKIVLVASSYSVLFSVSEALRALLHPLVWSHVYVPVLPLALRGCLHCPTPFIFGLHDAYVRRSEMPRPSADLVIVNLGRDSLTGGGDIFLPPTRHAALLEELFRLCKPHLTSRDSVDNLECNTPSMFPTRAVRRVIHTQLRELLASLEPCVSRFECKGRCVSVVDTTNACQWPADATRFCSALLHTQAVSTFLASRGADEKTQQVNSVVV
ncbi:hypothetical protein BBJ28_00004910 [Nothophytophthora sp. Chile5]|nr:hypothetical protein BBJ28_00004910 [Nothophytophthora sp. Chile5]